MTRYDVAIIGGGAAGPSAALVLSRARREVVDSTKSTERLGLRATSLYAALEQIRMAGDLAQG